jgi:NAD(P)-dependent dehydrogenase (short-subunit alcohol dehydrogenase family)
MSPFGRQTTATEVAGLVDLRGKQAVVTGASSGIGLATARALALAGADLVLGVRDLAKGEAAVPDITREAQGRVRLLTLDLRDLASVVAFADSIGGPVQLLIANAGVSKTPDAHLPNGLDVRFATNHLGHFLLAWHLRQQMAQHGARIVMVSSGAHHHAPIHLDDLQWHNRRHNALMAYAESKTANILFAQEASRRWAGDGIFANAALPGSSLTGLQRFHGEELKRRIGFIAEDGSLNPMLKTADQAAATTLWAATAPELDERGGLVLEDCAEAQLVGPDIHPWSGFDPSVADPDTARRLWDHSIELIRMVGFEAAPAGG